MFTVGGTDSSNVEVFCRGRWFRFAEILPTAHLIPLDDSGSSAGVGREIAVSSLGVGRHRRHHRHADHREPRQIRRAVPLARICRVVRGTG